MSSDPSTFQSPEHTQVNQDTHTQIADNSYPPATADHPRSDAPDPTTSAPVPKLSQPHGATTSTVHDASQGRQSTTAAAGASELASLKVKITAGLREIPDFPEPGILFVDIMPLFANIDLHKSLIRALELKVVESFKNKVDVIVGLDARGFLFGPSLALAIGASFVPMRKQGKLPGDTVKSTPFTKEYGASKPDVFEMQGDAVKIGDKVVIVDDIIATGKIKHGTNFSNAC